MFVVMFLSCIADAAVLTRGMTIIVKNGPNTLLWTYSRVNGAPVPACYIQS
jgi:hypothetical protein